MLWEVYFGVHINLASNTSVNTILQTYLIIVFFSLEMEELLKAVVSRPSKGDKNLFCFNSDDPCGRRSYWGVL